MWIVQYVFYKSGKFSFSSYSKGENTTKISDGEKPLAIRKTCQKYDRNPSNSLKMFGSPNFPKANLQIATSTR